MHGTAEIEGANTDCNMHMEILLSDIRNSNVVKQCTLIAVEIGKVWEELEKIQLDFKEYQHESEVPYIISVLCMEDICIYQGIPKGFRNIEGQKKKKKVLKLETKDSG